MLTILMLLFRDKSEDIVPVWRYALRTILIELSLEISAVVFIIGGALALFMLWH